MGSRAHGSAAPKHQRQRGSTNGINTGGIPHAKPNIHQPDGTRADNHPPLGPSSRRCCHSLTAVGCRQYTYDPELADLRSQGHCGSLMGDHAESAIGAH